jgi:hypothetical protein
MLGALLMTNEEKQEEAVQAAKTAVQLDPGWLGYWLNYGQVLMFGGKFEEAKGIAGQMMRQAKNEQEAQMVRQFQQNVSQFETMAASGARIRFQPKSEPGAKKGEKQGTEEDEDTAPPVLKLNKSETGEVTATAKPPGPPAEEKAKEPAGSGKKVESAPTGVKSLAPIAPIGQTVEGEGTITGVKCSGEATLEFKLDFGGVGIQLRAGNYTKILIEQSGGTVGPSFAPCKLLEKRAARVFYLTVNDPTYAGEIVKIEILK